jgi:inosine-uridine nucleoside N-ribohydrolase
MASMEQQQHRRRIIFDTDPGIDDSVALLTLLQCAEEQAVDLLAVTVTHGNVGVDIATRNAKAVVMFHHLWHNTRQPARVYKGAASPIDPEKLNPFAERVHGVGGLGNVATHDLDVLASLYDQRQAEQHQTEQQQPEQARSGNDSVPEAVQELVRLASSSTAHDGIEVIAVGPLTNLALAIQHSASEMQRLKRIYIMGGALLGAPGNITMLAEFNVFADPMAWHIVLQSKIPVCVYARVCESCSQATCNMQHATW